MTAEQAKELVRLVFGEEAAEDNDIVTFYKDEILTKLKPTKK